MPLVFDKVVQTAPLKVTVCFADSQFGPKFDEPCRRKSFGFYIGRLIIGAYMGYLYMFVLDVITYEAVIYLNMLDPSMKNGVVG